MNLIPLPFETRALTGYTHKAIVTYADLVSFGGASAAATVPLLDVRVGDVISKAAYRLVTAFDFSDAGINSCVMAVGDEIEQSRCIDSDTAQLAVDATEILYYAGNAVPTPLMPYAYLVANAIDAVFAISGGGSALMTETTSGEVEIFLAIANLVDLRTVI
jgi:hypothetical protein